LSKTQDYQLPVPLFLKGGSAKRSPADFSQCFSHAMAVALAWLRLIARQRHTITVLLDPLADLR